MTGTSTDDSVVLSLSASVHVLDVPPDSASDLILPNVYSDAAVQPAEPSNGSGV